jgi:hypothetical protein
MYTKEFAEILTIGRYNPKLRNTPEYRKAFNESRNAVFAQFVPANLNGTGFSEKPGCKILPMSSPDKLSTVKDMVEWCNNMAAHVGCHNDPLTPEYVPNKVGGYHCTEQTFGQ